MGVDSILVGSYKGRTKIREGMEASLSPLDRKRFAKATEEYPLELASDGTFTHKVVTRGTFEVCGDRVTFQPRHFNGLTLDSMIRAAEEAGRTFGLAWLFNPFELLVRGEELVTPDEGSAVYIAYSKSL
ncbi:MAG TPA: hypothetical protein VG944_22865 [Fimbriimonas sp.]|nr:hypothetical protein [Fimbriimonas sp.]